MTVLTTHQHQEQVREFTKTALECSAYVAPTEFGLTREELLEVAHQVGFQNGEVLDSLREATDPAEMNGDRYVPKRTAVWSQFHFSRDPDYRDFRAFEFICVELQKLVRSEGIAQAKLDRGIAVDRAVAAGIKRQAIEAAITILAHDEHIVIEDGAIRFAPRHEQYPLPSEQRAQSPEPVLIGRSIDSSLRTKIYAAVDRVIANRGSLPTAAGGATMYNLLVSAQSGVWDGSEFILPMDRFLEHTDHDIAQRLQQLNLQQLTEKLEALPTLFAYETPVAGDARIGWLTSIKRRERDMRITFRLDEEVSPIPSKSLAALKWELQIGDYELNRTHWAVKEVDVIAALQRGSSVHARPRPYSLTGTSLPSQSKGTTSVVDSRKVFVVHGRDSGSKNEVARFLERLKLTPVILHERPNAGRTLITKFQEESADITFAVVLMTPDDMGGLVDGPQSRRARQNVIFELGFFIGKLGSSRVCALVQGEIEKPSDFDAVVYIAYAANTNWKSELVRELQYAGLNIDANLAI